MSAGSARGDCTTGPALASDDPEAGADAGRGVAVANDGAPAGADGAGAEVGA